MSISEKKAGARIAQGGVIATGTLAKEPYGPHRIDQTFQHFS
jgi:hypothetical protein